MSNIKNYIDEMRQKDEEKLDRIKDDLERALNYVDAAQIDREIKDFKFRRAFGEEPNTSYPAKLADGRENLWGWWDHNYPPNG